jgi:hypothetical protein
MADDRKRARHDEVESYDGKNPPTGFAEGPGTYDLVRHIIGAFNLRPGWSYVDGDHKQDQRPENPYDHDPSVRSIGMGVSIGDAIRITKFVSSTRAVSRGWRDVVDRTLQNRDFALLVNGVPHPVSLRECCRFCTRTLLSPQHPPWDFDNLTDEQAKQVTLFFTFNSGSDWTDEHGAMPPAYDGELENHVRNEQLWTIDEIEGSLLATKQRYGHLTPATVETAVLGPQAEDEPEKCGYSQFLYDTAYKLLDEDVFLREYLGLSEDDMFEINRNARRVAPDDVPERVTKDAPYGMERDVEAELRAKYAIGSTGNVKPIYRPKGPPTAAPPGPPPAP